MGLTGYAENLDDGRVKVVAEGTAASCARLVDVAAPVTTRRAR